MSIARTRQSRLQFAGRVLTNRADSGNPGFIPALPNAAGSTVTFELDNVPSRGLIHRVAIAASQSGAGAVNNNPRQYDYVYLHYLGAAGANQKSRVYVGSMFAQLAYDQQNRNTLSQYSMSESDGSGGGSSGTSNSSFDSRFISIVDCVPVNCGGTATGGFYNHPHAISAAVAGGLPSALSVGNPPSDITPVIEGAAIRTTAGQFPPGGIFYDTQSPALVLPLSTVEGPNFAKGNKLYVTLLSEGFQYNAIMDSLTLILDIEPTH